MKLCDFDLRVAYEADGAVTVTELGDEVVSVVREESEDALHIRLLPKAREARFRAAHHHAQARR